MPLHARDIMQTRVVTVTPETPLMQVHRLFTEEEITGAPVVDDQDRLLGVISAADLLRAVETEHESVKAEPTYFTDQLPYGGPDWGSWPENFQDRLGELRVEDAMTEGAITVGPGATIPHIARTLRENRVHRVLVVEDRELVGVIAAFDLVALLEKPGLKE